MNMRIIPGVLAGLLCVQLAMVPVLATDDALDFYEGLMASQGQEGSVDLDSVEAEIVPADLNSGGSTVTVTTGSATETDTTTTTVPDITDTTDTTTTETTDTTTSTGTTTVPETEPAPSYTIKEVTLSSQYSSEYDLYEYSGGGYFYFYSNAKNGDIRSDSVYLDVPSDMSYTVKKDGTTISYTNKATITELGSYYFTLTYANEDTMTQYTASFRFRIEEPVETTTEAATTTVSPEEYVLGDDGVVRPTTETETDESGVDFDMEALDPDALDTDEELDLDLEAYLEDLTIEEDASQQEQSLECIYNDEAGYYQYTLLSGSYFYASVPNGMVTNGQATVYAGSESLVYTAYKDGVLLEEFLPGATVSEVGNYSIFITESTTQYWVAYDQVAEPVLTFTITDGTASNAVSVFAVPQLMTVTEITYNEEPLDITLGESHYYLSDDGVYSITMDSPINTQVLKLTKDTQPPQFTVDVTQDNLATITYLTDDVADCILSSGGDVISSGSWVYSVEDPGDYTLEVVDKAGNTTIQSFTVTYGLNSAAFVAIALAIALVVAGFFAYRRISRKVTVR